MFIGPPHWSTSPTPFPASLLMHTTHPLVCPSNFTREWPAFKSWVTTRSTPHSWLPTPATVAIKKWMHKLHFKCLQGPVPAVSGNGPLQSPPHWSTDAALRLPYIGSNMPCNHLEQLLYVSTEHALFGSKFNKWDKQIAQSKLGGTRVQAIPLWPLPLHVPLPPLSSPTVTPWP